MKLSTWIAAAAFAASVSLPMAASAADGKALFTTYKCNSCHTIKSQGIALGVAKPEEEAPDLSHVGTKHDKKWIALFLLKQQETDKGVKHKKRFGGEKEELKVLATWLESLK
ncbi:MAG: cytochrome c [Deltaproteobacteria bacterium]|nr:cytochrome c [Deltaproteobacteria bacterium]